MPTRSTDRIISLLCLAGAVLFWGTSFVGIKIALGSFTPMTVIWLRMIVATLVFLPFWRRLPRAEYQPGDLKWLALLALLQPCLYFLAEGYAVQFTTSSAAGVISALVPLMVAGGAWLFLREKLTARSGVAIVASLVGVVMLSVGGQAQASAPNPVLGNVLEVFAMAFAAGSMIALKHLSSRYHPWFLTAMQAAVGAVFFLPGAIASDPGTWVDASTAAWVAVVYLGIFVSLGAFGLYSTAISRMPASRAALSINLVPAVALVSGGLVLGESLAPVQLAGCAIIVGAVLYAETGQPATAEASPAALLLAEPAPDAE